LGTLLTGSDGAFITGSDFLGGVLVRRTRFQVKERLFCEAWENSGLGNNDMRPYIICDMLSSGDGKMDGTILGAVTPEGDYESTGSKLKGYAWICGRTTMQQHFAGNKLFVSRSTKAAGPQPVFVARRAKSYAISVDTVGNLRWTPSARSARAS
jgi:hypothetical protein